MSLANALSGYKKQLEDAKNDEKIKRMLEEQNSLLNKYSSEKKAKKKSFDELVLEVGGMTHYNFNKKWYRISVLPCHNKDDDFEITKFKFHFKNGFGHTVFISAKTYSDAQAVVNDIYGDGMYKVSASVV